MFLALLGSATLSKCAFVSEIDGALELKTKKNTIGWPRTHILVFEVQDEQSKLSNKRTDLLGPNLSFTTPTCSRLRLSAEHSGETYAGHMMRQRMHFGPCRAIAVSQEKHLWNWPWAHGAPRADLPPDLKGTYGAWDLRCMDRDTRSRCALVQSVKPTEKREIIGSVKHTEHSERTEHQGAGITSHFTMAIVRGKAMPVWRVWIPRAKKNWFRGLTIEGQENWERMLNRCIKSRSSFTKCLNHARAEFTDRRTTEIWLSVEQDRRNLTFTKCVDEGCMVETPIDMSAKAYAAFLRGRSVSIKLHPLGHMPLQFELQSNGFSEAIEAFSNIDQTENTLQASDKRKAL